MKTCSNYLRFFGIAIALGLSGCERGTDRGEEGDPATGESVTDGSDETGAEPVEVLFYYDSDKGLQIYDPAGKRFASYGKLTPDNPDQDVRALDFAVRSSDMTICATDGQGSGYPFYTVDLKERRLIQVGTAGDFSYSSISYNPKNGLLYGVIWTGPHEDFFVIIDPKSGGVHRIASIVTGAKIAFAPDGTLYAIISGGYLDPGIESGQLYQINHETGGHKLIGMANLDYKSSRFFISKRGTGYVLEHTGKLRTIDLQTAETKLVADSGSSSVFGLFDYVLPANELPGSLQSDK